MTPTTAEASAVTTDVAKAQALLDRRRARLEELRREAIEPQRGAHNANR